MDNSSCKAAISVNDFLAGKNITVATQPPCLLDLSPCDFSTFRDWKIISKKLILRRSKCNGDPALLWGLNEPSPLLNYNFIWINTLKK